MIPGRTLLSLALLISLTYALILAGTPRPTSAQSQPPQSVSKLPWQKPDVKFTGEISSGNSFERDIGQGLIFRLVPSPAGFGKGWDIEIVPKDNPSGGPAEFSAIVTPPYHFYNLRYLNASYGVTAREAVAMSPRAFQFVESPEDFAPASVVVNSVIYSVEWPAKKDSLAAAAAKIPLGAGELRVLRSRITAGKNNEDLGSIDWLKFEVRLRLHSGLTLQQILFSGSVPPH